MAAAADSARDLNALLARCLRREPAAQRALYARYAGLLLGVARRYATSRTEAEDIVQDAFVKVFTHLGEFRADGSLEGWLRCIVVTTALNHWQAGRPRPMAGRPLSGAALAAAAGAAAAGRRRRLAAGGWLLAVARQWPGWGS